MRSMRILAFFGFLPIENDQHNQTRKIARIAFNVFLDMLLIPSVSIIMQFQLPI